MWFNNPRYKIQGGQEEIKLKFKILNGHENIDINMFSSLKTCDVFILKISYTSRIPIVKKMLFLCYAKYYNNLHSD